MQSIFLGLLTDVFSIVCEIFFCCSARISAGCQSLQCLESSQLSQSRIESATNI